MPKLANPLRRSLLYNLDTLHRGLKEPRLGKPPKHFFFNSTGNLHVRKWRQHLSEPCSIVTSSMSSRSATQPGNRIVEHSGTHPAALGRIPPRQDEANGHGAVVARIATCPKDQNACTRNHAPCLPVCRTMGPYRMGKNPVSLVRVKNASNA